MTILENELLRIQIQDHGAQISSLFAKSNQTEWLWQADPAFWGRHAPILFPIVGRLKDDQYRYEGKYYVMKQHGFARDQTFKLVLKTDKQAVFRLSENEETLKQYPFSFELTIRYSIHESELSIDYEVKNTGPKPMPFSIGAHPAFNCPSDEKSTFEDYVLEFDKSLTAKRYLLSDGLYNGKTEPVLQENRKLKLNYDLFDKDAIVFKHLEANTISLKKQNSEKGLEFQFAGFPYLGIWTKRNAPFVCIEPWFGLADNTHHQQDIFEKEGIIVLDSKGVFTCNYAINISE